MPALTRLALLITCGVGLLACKEVNPAYCRAHPFEPICPDTALMDAPAPLDDARPGEQACDDNTDCKRAGFAVCELAVGECVQCAPNQTAACQGTTPVCNASFTCEACRVSADCASGVCLASGACVAETDIAYVDSQSIGGTDCTQLAPCKTIQSGLAAMTAGAPRPYLKLRGTLDEAVVINRNVTLLAEPGTQLTRGTDGPIVSVTGTSVVEINDLLITESNRDGDPGIITSDMSELTLKRVTISRNEGNGISCAGKSLVVSDSTISENELVGISCTAGKVIVSSSTVTKNNGGGIALGATSFDITNNFIVRNGAGGPGGSIVGGVSIPATAVSVGSRFEFNTVVDNQTRDSGFLPGGVLCDVSLAAPNNIIARNLVNGDPTRSSSNTFGLCTYPTSSISQDVTTLNFASADSDPRDYHIKTGSIAIGQATTASTVTVDADGEARPQGAGNDQGADELKAP
jgi:hypothetical protein